MGHTYQSHYKSSQMTDEISKRKKHSDKLAQMKASGTYCDSEDPDLSFLNLRSSCKICPNYSECKETSEERSKDILKYRRKSVKNPKTKRKGGKKK